MKQAVSKYVHVAVADTQAADYERALLDAQTKLAQLLDQGHKVYIMSTASFSRAQTLVLLYLTQNRTYPNWWNLEHIWDLLRHQ